MTAFSGSPYSRQLTAASPNIGVPEAGADHASVVALLFSLPASHGNTLAQDDTINLGYLPKGFAPRTVQYRSDAFGTSVTLALSANDGSARSLLAATSIASAASGVAPAAYLQPLAARSVLVATLGGGNPADNVGFEVVVYGVQG